MGWGWEGGGGEGRLSPCLIQYRVYYCVRLGCTYTTMEALGLLQEP